MRARKDVDAIDLQEAELVDRSTQLRRADITRTASRLEALRRQGNSARFRKGYLRAQDRSPEVAQAWLLRRSPNIFLIPGTSSVTYLREPLAVGDLELPDTTFAELNALAA